MKSRIRAATVQAGAARNATGGGGGREARGRRTVLHLLGAGFVLMTGEAAGAEALRDFPQPRPIRMVAPFAAGGSSDLFGRYLAPKLAQRLGQNVVVENRPGAGGMIGASIVAKGTPDGHTLLLPSGAFTAHAASVKNLPYDPVRDFTWISTLLTYPFVVIVKADSPLRTVGDFIAEAKRRPGKLAYGSVGVGSVFHLSAELFNSMAKIETLHVPFKGGNEPLVALLGGQIDIIFSTITGSMPHIQAQRVRAIAVASKEPSSQLPGVPTVAETLPGFDVTSFSAVSAPPGVPRPIVARLNRELHAVLRDAETLKHVHALGGEVRPSTPEELRQRVESEIDRWRRIVAERRIEVR
jgi:tripartite-type tricarboxylate transporter receptor subunit TctC